MHTDEKRFFNIRPDFEKLRQYGFVKQDDFYVLSADIMSGAFCFNIYVTLSGITSFEVIDKATNDEYILAYNQNAVGSFIGAVRSECESIINDVIASCYEPCIFKTKYAKLIIGYIRDKYGAQAEYLWEKFPNNAIFREEKTQKWFAALLTVEKRKLGIDEDGNTEIIDLKDTPDNITSLVDGKAYLAGYHMNKKHWYTIRLDESVHIEEIYERIDKSFDTLKKRK